MIVEGYWIPSLSEPHTFAFHRTAVTYIDFMGRAHTLDCPRSERDRVREHFVKHGYRELRVIEAVTR